MSGAIQTDDRIACPACGNGITMRETCIVCSAGDTKDCPSCAGTGTARWCPKCGRDYWQAKRRQQQHRSANVKRDSFPLTSADVLDGDA